MQRSSQSRIDPLDVANVLERSLTQHGQSLATLSESSPILVVFLRQAGCIFCREALGDIARSRAEIERLGARIVLVHMGDVESIEAALRRHDLSFVDRICDPAQELYHAFGLQRGTFSQLFGFKVAWRSLLAGARFGIGSKSADAAQMPGVFLIERSAIVRRYRHRSAADRPNYAMLCVPAAV